MPPRTKPPEKRRDDLLDAGQRVFVEKGISAATIDDITRAAGVAKGTFYLYFSSKDHLLTALKDRFVDEVLERILAESANTAHDDWAARLDAWVSGCVRGYIENARIHDVLFFHQSSAPAPDSAGRGEPPRHGEETRGGDNKLVAALSELLRQGANAGVFTDDNPDETALFLYSAAHGAVEHALHASAAPSVKYWTGATQSFFRRLLACAPTQASRARTTRPRKRP